MHPGSWLIVLALAGLPTAALAASPTETVKAFYDHPGRETEPAARNDFIDPAKKILDLNDAILKGGEAGCLDPGLAVDNADPKSAEIASSLKFAESVSGSEAKVIVGFTVDQHPHRMEWKLKRVGDDWKIYDLLSVTGEWALSQFGCE